MKFTIRARLPSLNDYVNVCRTNKYGANKFKHDAEDKVYKGYTDSHTGELGKPPYQVHLKFCEPNARRDVDNVAHGVKYILDSLVKHGVLENDNQKFIKKIASEVLIDKENPHIEVEIEEYRNDN